MTAPLAQLSIIEYCDRTCGLAVNHNSCERPVLRHWFDKRVVYLLNEYFDMAITGNHGADLSVSVTKTGAKWEILLLILTQSIVGEFERK